MSEVVWRERWHTTRRGGARQRCAKTIAGCALEHLSLSQDVPATIRSPLILRVPGPDIQPQVVISWDTSPAVAMTLLVNFGVFAGRDVSKIELERLGVVLLRIVDRVTVISEHRFELAAASSIDLHQVRVAIDRAVLPPDEPDIEALRTRIVGLLEGWVRSCLTEVSGMEFTYAELEARDAVVEGVLDEL